MDEEEKILIYNNLKLRRKDIKEEIKKIEKEIFKYETICLDTSYGNPVIKSLEFYASTRSERKKYVVRDLDRVFSTDLPHMKEKPS